MMRVYLDTCCVNRLTDDQTQPRIRDEAIAIERILELLDAGQCFWVSSETVEAELLQNPNELKRHTALAFLPLASERLTVTPEIQEDANQYAAQGYGSADALHLALAEAAKVEWLLTVDDRFLRRAANRPDTAWPRVFNPLEWWTRRRIWLLKR